VADYISTIRTDQAQFPPRGSFINLFDNNVDYAVDVDAAKEFIFVIVNVLTEDVCTQENERVFWQLLHFAADEGTNGFVPVARERTNPYPAQFFLIVKWAFLLNPTVFIPHMPRRDLLENANRRARPKFLDYISGDANNLRAREVFGC
jgi:hypothetical protein